jgi:hypothetical protein
MRYTFPTPPAQQAAPRPPDPVMVAEAQRVLREALGRMSEYAGRAAYCAALTAPMATLCEEAKRRDLRIEQLIVAVKCAWARRPDARWWRRDADGDLLSLIVTVCIEQYFLDSDRARDASLP